MVNEIDRRDALAVLSFVIATEAAFASAAAQEVAQADARTATSPAITSAANVEPASHVSGDYHAVYQEGYGQAFLALGFSEEFLLQMFSEATENLTITATAKPVFLRARSGNAQRQITLGSSGPGEVFGAKMTGMLGLCSQIGS